MHGNVGGMNPFIPPLGTTLKSQAAVPHTQPSPTYTDHPSHNDKFSDEEF